MSKTEKIYPLSTIGGRIQHLRRQQGLRREELHELIAEKQISRVFSYDPQSQYKTIKGWESGKTAPSLEQINAMCDIFGCSADYLLGRIETKTHEMGDVSEYTGLTTTAVGILNNIAGRFENLENMQPCELLNAFSHRCDPLVISLILEYCPDLFTDIANYVVDDLCLYRLKEQFHSDFGPLTDEKDRRAIMTFRITHDIEDLKRKLDETRLTIKLFYLTGYGTLTKEERLHMLYGFKEYEVPSIENK